MTNKNKTIYGLILFSLFISLFYAKYNINNFDKNILTESEKSVHLMIKNDPFRYFSHGYEIKEKLKLGINYFETGKEILPNIYIQDLLLCIIWYLIIIYMKILKNK